jgi:hypothetical protein
MSDMIGIMLIIIVISLLVASMAVYLNQWIGHDYPANPLRWAQEGRERENKARARHISRLEHELGYRPCSAEHCLDPKCIVAGVRNGGHPIWDNPALPAPPPMDLTAMVQRAYDSQVAWGTKTIPMPPPPTAEPGRIKK